jgi:hypothetical protein
MAELDGLLDMIPVGDIAKQLGIDESTAKAAVAQVVPALVAGMAANAQDKGGAESLAGAATRHAERKTDFKNVANINTEDGAKVARNVFGSNTQAVEQKVAAAGGIDPSIIQKLIPIIAPIVIAFIGNMLLNKQKDSGSSTTAEPATSGGGGIGDILGGLLGGGGGSSSSSSSGGGMGDILGGVLGGLLGGGKK